MHRPGRPRFEGDDLGRRREKLWVKCANRGAIFPGTDQHQDNGCLSEKNLQFHDDTLPQTAGRSNGTYIVMGRAAVVAYKTELH
jgi:hypothetical protein